MAHVAAAVLLPLSVVLVGFTLLGVQIPDTIHVTGHLLVFALLASYPVFRLTRWLVGRLIALTRTRWAVWN